MFSGRIPCRALRFSSKKKFSTTSRLFQVGKAGSVEHDVTNMPDIGTRPKTNLVEKMFPSVSDKKSPLAKNVSRAIPGGILEPDSHWTHVDKHALGYASGNGKSVNIDWVWLRDACGCERCIDPSTRQKRFQTTDIAAEIKAIALPPSSDKGLRVVWENDLPGFDAEHISTYSREFLELYGAPQCRLDGPGIQPVEVTWNAQLIKERIKFLEFDKYMTLDAELYTAIEQLRIYGIVFIKGVPDTETAVEDIGGRIGNLRDTFYGRTWDVKSVPQAKNVAYTNQNLGFHMDLLYMNDPPGLQLLHCIKNSCEGGSSLFSDSFLAVGKMMQDDPSLVYNLENFETQYHYHNDGKHYRNSHRTIETASSWEKNRPRPIKYVNWSPPFQAPFAILDGSHREPNRKKFREYLQAAKAFAAHLEAPENIYEYRMQEGECVIFNNRRTLHARRAFDISSGERWLKGAYVDTDVFLSRYRSLHEKISQHGAVPG